MELGSIIFPISTIYQKLVQQVWWPTEHYSFRALCDYCNKSYWCFFFMEFPQKFENHELDGKLFMVSLISLITMPLLPQLVPNYALTSSVISFLSALLSKYSSGCASNVGSPVILKSATFICTGLSIHKMPMCMRATSCLMQSLMFLLHPK
jgi:hypothetical protein